MHPLLKKILDPPLGKDTKWDKTIEFCLKIFLDIKLELVKVILETNFAMIMSRTLSVQKLKEFSEGLGFCL